MRRTLFASVIAILGVLSLAAPATAVGRFVDDDGNVHEQAIEHVAAAGIAAGCDADRFCPIAPVTRAQMATFVVQLLSARGATLPAQAADAFDDDNGNLHESNINVMASLGITGGTGPRQFSPGDPVIRSQMATFLTRALALAAPVWDAFDDDAGNLHESGINSLALRGITGGCASRQYCATDAIRRDQMATFLSRASGPPPAPRVYEGQGDSIVPVSKPIPNQPAIAAITHSGTSNFIVVEQDALGERGGSLVNEIGNYVGTVLVDEPLFENSDTTQLEVDADGAWRIEILPLTGAPVLESFAEGTGDAVLGYVGIENNARLTHAGESNFIVWSYGDVTELVVNEIGPYDGTNVFPPHAQLIEVNADGAWTIDPVP